MKQKTLRCITYNIFGRATFAKVKSSYISFYYVVTEEFNKMTGIPKTLTYKSFIKKREAKKEFKRVIKEIKGRGWNIIENRSCKRNTRYRS